MSLPRRIMLLGTLSVLAGCSTDEAEDASAFTQADLAGRWRYTIVFAGPTVQTGGPGWARGTISVDGSGTATVETFADSTGSTTVPSLAPISYAIDADGVVTANTTVFTGGHGKMNSSKTLFAMTATQGTGPAARARLGMYQKIAPGTSFAASDVAPSSFRFRQLAVGAEPSWERGDVVVGANGGYSVVNVVDPLGSKPDASDVGVFSVSGEGVVTTTEDPSFAAFMSADKQMMLATRTAAFNEHRLTALVRSAAGFAQADLAGRWHYVNLATTLGSAGWAHGTVSFDGMGVGTFGPQLDSSGATETPPSVTLSLGSDGTVTQTSPAPSVFSGVLDPAKEVLIATETHEDGVYGLIVAIRYP